MLVTFDDVVMREDKVPIDIADVLQMTSDLRDFIRRADEARSAGHPEHLDTNPNGRGQLATAHMASPIYLACKACLPVLTYFHCFPTMCILFICGPLNLHAYTDSLLRCMLQDEKVTFWLRSFYDRWAYDSGIL